MKKLSMILPLALILCIMVGCQDKEEKIDRIMEDGAEVIINHLEPYKIAGEPSKLFLEEIFTVDTEMDEIAEIGVTDIRGFDVDSQGNIYFFQERENDENLVYKFDETGNFATTFGKRGQGPKEIEIPIFTYINDKNEILIKDYNKPRLFFFDKDGNLTKETHLGKEYGSNRVFYPLENGNYLSYDLELDQEKRHLYDIAQLFDSNFEVLKELDKCDYGPMAPFTPKFKGTARVFICRVSNRMIYIGHINRGYEILIFDSEGNLVKKVRKEYTPTDVPNEFKENWLVNIGRWKDKLYFPDEMPPFHYFFLDDDGRLYVKTYEKGNKENEYIHDIFNPEGIFIARVSIAGYGSWIYPQLTLNRAKAKNKRFYCIREKEDGFKELVVYKMRWE